MLRIVGVEGFREAVFEMAIYNFEQTDHLKVDFEWLTWLQFTEF